jgi:serine-type D-Ala-D-Ala carboxypeptidase (penicillin-binding protein 5/6)
MSLGARPKAVTAALLALSCPTVVALVGAQGASAAQAAQVTRAAQAAPAVPASSTPNPSGTSPSGTSPSRTGTSGTGPSGTGTPTPGSTAALAVGGPQMASTGTVVNYPATGAKQLPKIPASAWIIANAGTGQVLAARDPHGEYGPASTLKVLTAVTLIPLLNPNAMVMTSKHATQVVPSVVGLIAGHAYKVADLFRALLLISANDAAVALTEATGSFTKGMALINAEAHKLQAYDVVAKVPNGLPAAGQVTSAYDEALIARQALSMPAFMQYDSTLAAKFEVKPRKWVTLVNQNALLTQYKGALGGKIGWTISSKATYVGMARRNGVTLIVAVLHCTPLEEITAGEKLLDWGFDMNGKVRPVGVLVPPLSVVAAQKRAVVRANKTAALTASPSPSSSPAAGLAVAAGAVVIAGLGVSGVARSRRRRQRPF